MTDRFDSLTTWQREIDQANGRFASALRNYGRLCAMPHTDQDLLDATEHVLEARDRCMAVIQGRWMDELKKEIAQRTAAEAALEVLTEQTFVPIQKPIFLAGYVAGASQYDGEPDDIRDLAEREWQRRQEANKKP